MKRLKESNIPNSNQSVTRVERHEAFEVFIDIFEPLFYCFEDIKDSGGEWNRETSRCTITLALRSLPFDHLIGYNQGCAGVHKSFEHKALRPLQRCCECIQPC